jgi:hypothetical protein
MRYTVGSIVALLSATALALPVEAQTSGIYVAASVIADDDRTNSRLTERPAASWTVAAGMDLTRNAGIRILIDAPRQVRTVAEGITSHLSLEPGVRYKLTRTERSMTFSALLDLHGQVTPRVKLAAIAGIARVTHDDDTVVVREKLHPDGTASPLPDQRQTGAHPWMGISVGVEAPVLLTQRLEVVPELRVICFFPSDSPSPYIIRSGAGVRWRF